MEHIDLEYEARKIRRNRSFTTDQETTEYGKRLIADHAKKLRKMGIGDEPLAKLTSDLVGGLANQLFNIPLDMIIEKRLYEGQEPLRPSQFLSLFGFQAENLKAVTDPEIRRLSPPLIYRASATLNCAYALCLDSIYAGRADYSASYKKLDVYGSGRRLFEIWRESVRNYGHGDEYDLVDRFAKELQLGNWYKWMRDPHDEESIEGVTNLELLRAKQPAAVMYCLSALERYEGMSTEEIMKIAGEIALLGRTGIDYTKPDQRYSLQSIPGQQFSGLQLLCLMYVGFQKAEPTLDVGLDLKDAFEVALKLYRSPE